MYTRICSLSVSLRPQLLMLGLSFWLGGVYAASGQTNSTTVSQTLPSAPDEGTIRERIATIIRETLKQGEGTTVEGYSFFTWMPSSDKDVEEIKSYGDKAAPSRGALIFRRWSRGPLSPSIAWPFRWEPDSRTLKRVAEQSTSASRRATALTYLTQAPWELAFPIIRNAAETDRDPEVRAEARDLLVRYSPKRE
jgi:hypothetical protein